MKLAKKVLALALTMFVLVCVGSAQTPRSENDPRNTAPTVGTGGPPGGATGLFTIFDGSTLRRGEYTFSIAYSNFDRDPGDVDITEVPISFQIGVNDHLELWFQTDAYRAMKVNAQENLSGFRLPNSQMFRPINGFNQLVVPSAIIIAPNGIPNLQGQGIFRPDGRQPFIQYPYVGGFSGTYFPFATVIGNPIAVGEGAAQFPGVGSPAGSILPGLTWGTVALNPSGVAPLVFTNSPAYLPDAPFLNRHYGETAFSTFTAGAKWRFTGPNNPVGVGIIPFYRWYADKASSIGGFNQLQRGASPGGNRGDIGLIFFTDARLRKWVNVSANVGFIHNSDVKAKFPTGTFTLLDRPDELQAGIGIDFPVNKFFQPIGEVRTTRYVGGRTPNALEHHPIEALAGFRIFPTRWFSMGFWYRYDANEQDFESFDDSGTQTVTVVRPAVTGGPAAQTITSTIDFQQLRGTFPFSTDPHGFGGQITIGRRNSRGTPPVIDVPADVTGLDLGDTEIVLGCPPGMVAGSSCNESSAVSVKTTAVDKENDQLVYNYTVSGGRIVGQGSSVNWDLAGVNPGTYTITAGVDDGCGVCGKTQTKTVTVKQCADCQPPPCECPTVSVTGPSSVVAPGSDMVFTANVSGGSSCNPTYNWSVSAGTITSGQGTPVIHVGTDASMAGSSVTATVELGGCCPECHPTSSETAGVAPKLTPRKIDEFGDTKHDQIRPRLDNFFVELQNDPTSHGIVIVSGPAKVRKDIIKLVNDHIKFRSFDASRIKIVDGGDAAAADTQLWLVPAGADDPAM